MSTPEYQVISQVRRTELTPDGGATQDGVRVTFKDVRTGVSSSVFVADDFYTPENVRTLILDKLQTIRGIQGLTD